MGQFMDGMVSGELDPERLARQVEALARVAALGNVRSVRLSEGGLTVKFYPPVQPELKLPPARKPTKDELLFGSVDGFKNVEEDDE